LARSGLPSDKGRLGRSALVQFDRAGTRVMLEWERGKIGGASEDARAAFFTGRDARATGIGSERRKNPRQGRGCATGIGSGQSASFRATLILA